MAPGITSPVPGNITSPFYSSLPGNSRHVSAISSVFESDDVSNSGRSSRRELFTPRKVNGSSNANINSLIQSLCSDSGVKLGNAASALMDTDHGTITSWIRHERMSYLPPAGSSYDKVLSWAEFFVDRLRDFDNAIHDDSYLAANFAYGYCGLLLELGKENKKNAEALMTSFGFFYSLSASLVNLLERVELFDVSVDISSQLGSCLADLVRLVATVATRFHNEIRSRRGWVSFDIYDTFHKEISSFRARCDSIADAMWRHQLSRESNIGRVSDVKSIRSWLAPEDRVLSNLAENSSHLAHEREEMTCQWVDQYLSHFLKSPQTIMSFSGKPGSGKTVLASVIVDILQKVIGGVAYQTLFIPINARIPAETSPTAIAKTILFQLFEKRIGNVQLLQFLSDAYERSRQITNVAEYENTLWSAVERGLAATFRGAKELVIVVDGLDEASCPEQALFKRLTAALDTAVNVKVNVKLITLGAERQAESEKVMDVPVSEDRIYEDISLVVRNIFAKDHGETFNQLSVLEQEIIVDQITGASQGSFQWAKLCTKQARHEHNPEDMKRVVETLIKNKPSVADLVVHTLSQPKVTEEAKYMLLWLATADRPLVLKELTALASIQVDKQTVTDRKVKPREVLMPLVSLVFLQDGLVYLRHGLIRTAILDVFSKGKLLPAVKDRHLDFVTRLLVYIKNTVTEGHEPSFSPIYLHPYETNQLTSKNHLLEFAVRYWPYHLRQTTTYTTGGDAPTAKEFSKLFPVTVTLLLLQTALWQNISTPNLVSFQTTVTNLTRQILTTDSPVTLQSILTLALMYRDIGQISEATALVYELTTRKVLKERPMVAMHVANLFLELTDDKKTDSKTDVMIKREEIFKLVIKCYEDNYGTSSEQVVSTYRTLIEHYRLTKEETKIRETEVTIQKITGEYGADQTDDHGDIQVMIQGNQPEREISGILDLEVEHDEVERDAFDSHALLKLAEDYTAEGRITEAERIYVKIWQRASNECRTQYSETWEQTKLKAVLVYAQFLRSQKRVTEAASILSSVWEEYRHSSLFVSGSSVSHFEEIVEVMKDVGLSTTALNILKHVAQYYKSTTQSSAYSKVMQHIHLVEKLVKDEASSSSWSKSESVLVEIIYDSYQSGSKIDQRSFEALYALVKQYFSEHRWKDSTRVLKKILRTLWPSLFSPSINDVSLPTEYTDKCVRLAGHLSECYRYRRRFTREEGIRVRVYRALRAAKPVDDETRKQVTTELVDFYRRTSDTDRGISTLQEILHDQVQRYAPEDPVVIKTLWELAVRTHPRPICVEYYERIIKAVNKDSRYCHPDMIEPLVIVVDGLWSQSRYSDAESYYALLFDTFLNDHKKSTRFQDMAFVQGFFTRYTLCLRNICKDYNFIHKVTTDYRNKVKDVFSATATIYIKATLTLAEVSQETKDNMGIAIELYNELLNIQSNEIDHKEIKAILDGIHEEQVAVALDSSSASSEEVKTAASVLKKRFHSICHTHGWATEESLSKLEQMVSFHAKYKETSVLSVLQESTFEILSTESSSTRLLSAAMVIASSYIATEQVSKATELTKEIYRQIVLKDTSNLKTYKYDLSSKGRQSLIFLAQLEHSLFKRTSTVTEILASLTTEYVYFEEFRSQLSSKSATFYSVSKSATRLRSFLRRNDHELAATRVFSDYVAYFLATEGRRTKLTETAQVEILLKTLLEHFSTHRSSNLIRSVGIASNYSVLKLLEEKDYGGASDLALAAFHYISAQDVFHTPAIVKFVFTLGVHITGRTITPQPDQAAQKKLVDVSSVIMQGVLRVFRDLNINLAQISLEYLNILIGVLSEQKHYKNLAWLLSGLWNSRNRQGNWPASITLQLAHLYIRASYLTGDGLNASRLAENIVYNYRRVNGPCHTSTLQMSVLLSQLYTGVAQQFQSMKDGQQMASKLYKRSAALHEYLLRVFIDPSLADFDGGLENSLSLDGSVDLDFGVDLADDASAPDGENVRQHLELLRLAVQRLGDWPKDYSEFKRLDEDLRAKFGSDLEGVENVEKWNPKSFGSGKAAGNEDTVNLDFKSWELEIKVPQ